MALHVFPAQIFKPRTVNARPIVSTVSGGVPIEGEEEVVATDGGGSWVIEMSGIALRTADQQRAWSAWMGYLENGTTPCLVPVLSLTTAPRPDNGKQVARPPQLDMDDPLFPTSVVYSAPYIVAHVAANAALRATSLQIVVDKGGSIKGGEKFSIGQYAYRIVRRTGTDTFAIRPPLREAVSEDDPVVFDWPLTRAALRPGEDYEGAITDGIYGEKSITFVERIEL